MAKTIWKYPLALTDVQEITLPLVSQVISVAEQYGQIVLYAIVDPATPEVRHKVYIVGTGHVHDDEVFKAVYIGTAKLLAGQAMFHVFVSP